MVEMSVDRHLMKTLYANAQTSYESTIVIETQGHAVKISRTPIEEVALKLLLSAIRYSQGSPQLDRIYSARKHWIPNVGNKLRESRSENLIFPLSFPQRSSRLGICRVKK
jgi:hypothetical protein